MSEYKEPSNLYWVAFIIFAVTAYIAAGATDGREHMGWLFYSIPALLIADYAAADFLYRKFGILPAAIAVAVTTIPYIIMCFSLWGK